MTCPFGINRSETNLDYNSYPFAIKNNFKLYLILDNIFNMIEI